MTDHQDGLDALSSEDLHDRAVKRAKRHLDAKFFYELIRLLPTAEAAAGDLSQAEDDVLRLSAHVSDIKDAGKGEVAEMLRPFYLEDLRKHRVKA